MLKYMLALLLVMVVQLPQIGYAAKYACQDKNWGGKDAKFVMLTEDDVNFREKPEDGRVIRTFDNHTLFRVIKENGKWLLVESATGRGFVFAAKTGEPQKEELLIEDFDLKFVDLNAPYDPQELEPFLGTHLSKVEDKGRLTIDYKNLQLVVDAKGYIVEMTTKDPQLTTMRGVGVGDLENRLAGQYGAPATVEYGWLNSLYTYYCRVNQDYLYNMEFIINAEGRIDSIRWSVVEKPAHEKKVKLKKPPKVKKQSKPKPKV